jgi:hypothetical protein
MRLTMSLLMSWAKTHRASIHIYPTPRETTVEVHTPLTPQGVRVSHRLGYVAIAKAYKYLTQGGQ